MMPGLATATFEALIRLRERRLQQERERVAKARVVVQDAAQALVRARALHAERVAACSAHAQRLRQRSAAVDCSVAALRGEIAFARRLDARVADALPALHRALEEHAAGRAALAQQMRRLRAADAQLRAVHALDDEQQRAGARQREARADDVLDDAARQQWLALRRAA